MNTLAIILTVSFVSFLISILLCFYIEKSKMDNFFIHLCIDCVFLFGLIGLPFVMIVFLFCWLLFYTVNDSNDLSLD